MNIGQHIITKPGTWYGRDISNQTATITTIKQMFSLSLGKNIDYFYVQWDNIKDWCPIVSCPEFWFDPL